MLTDTMNRPMRDLRISVTDRCNFRCTYCMPFDEYKWMERNEVLSFEEIERLAVIFSESFGVEKIRLTGGEPLVRRNLDQLVAALTQARRRRWTRQTWDLVDVGSGERVVLLFLAYRADEDGRTPQLSIDEIGRACNMARNVVFRYLRLLEERGFLMRERRYTIDGGLDSSSFLLLESNMLVQPLHKPHLMRHSFNPENTGLAIWSV